MRMGMAAWSEIATVDEGAKRARKRQPQYNAQGNGDEEISTRFQNEHLLSLLAGPLLTLGISLEP
jgi:hypothetical protein